MLLHAQGNGRETTGHQPGVEGTENTAVVHHGQLLDLVNHLRTAKNAAAQRVTVAIDVLGHAVNLQICAMPDRIDADGAGEGSVYAHECSGLVGDFGKALEKVLEQYHPDRILIEPSGVGKLSDVIRAVQNIHAHDVELDGFTTVVDAKKCKMYQKNFGEFFNNQITYASCLILSHTAGLSQDKLDDCVSRLRTCNEKAPIVTTDWDQLTGKQLVEAMTQKNTLDDELQELLAEAAEHDHHHHHHHADEVFTSWGIETPNTYSAEDIEKILTALDSGEYGAILRAKGMVPAPDGTWVYYDYVPEEHDIRSGKPEVTGKICVIGSKLDEDKLAELFRK